MSGCLRRSAYGASDGFTLIELLIATALLSLFTLLLFGGLRFGTRAWEVAERGESVDLKIAAAEHSLTDRIANAYPLYVFTNAQDGHIEFDGSAGGLAFLAPAASGGFDRVLIGTERWRGHLALAVWTKPELSNGGFGKPQRLIDGVTKVDFAYFGATKPREAPAWRADWQHALLMPRLVRIRLAFADRHAVWPDLDIAPHVEVDQGCVYDQLTKYCQGRA